MTDSSGQSQRGSIHPALEPDKFERLEASFFQAQDAVRLARLYLTFAQQESEASSAVARLRAGANRLAQVPDSEEQVSWVLHELVRLDPTDLESFESVRAYYESTSKDRELARLAEEVLASDARLDADHERSLRSSLFELYKGKLADPAKAAAQLAGLLAKTGEQVPDGWLDEAEELLKTKALVKDLGGPLAAVYQRLGRSSQELSVLTRELEVARGARLREVQKRLAVLRQDFLDDADGALELLEPFLSKDPSDDDSRRRYLEITAQQGKSAEAARLLKRAAKSLKSPEAKVAVALDLAVLFLELAEPAQAKAELAHALGLAVKSEASLKAARLLMETEPDLEENIRVDALAAIALNETEPDARQDAADALLELLKDATSSDAMQKKKIAYLALLDTPRASSLLDELQALCQATDDAVGMSAVFQKRSEFAEDPGQAAAFAFRAAELYEQRASVDEALDRWRRFSEKYPSKTEATDRMADLLEKAERYEELVPLLLGAAESRDAAEAAVLLARAGTIQLAQFKEAELAIKSFERSLSLNPTEERSIAALEDLLARSDHRLAAAGVLEAAARLSHTNQLLVDVLCVKAELLPEMEARLRADLEAFELLKDKIRDPRRALAIAGRVLKDIMDHDVSLLGPWLERIRAVEVSKDARSLKARILLNALGDTEITSASLLALACDAGRALGDAEDYAAANAIYDRALMYDPTSPDLAIGMDALRAKEGVPAEQRVAQLELSLIDVEENLVSWCRVMGAIANIKRLDLGDPEDAVSIYRDVIERSPTDRDAHRALVEIYTDVGDQKALAAELERAVGVFTGTDQLRAEFDLAMLRADAGDAGRAIELCGKLLESGQLESDQLDSIADLAEQNEDMDLLRRVQERRVSDIRDPLTRAQELERLASLLVDRVKDPAAGAEAYRRAAREALGITGEEEYAKTLFEKVLEVTPDDRDTAERLFRLCVEAGDWDRAPSGFSALVKMNAPHAGRFLLSFEERAKNDLAAARFVGLADEVIWALEEADEFRQRLQAAKARVLASDPDLRAEASQAFRALLEAHGQSDDEQTFEKFIADCPLDDARKDDQRWLLQRRARSAEDPVPALLEWARVEEEEFEDPEGALGVYEKILQSRSDERRALERSARLKLQLGEYEGALQLLQALKSAVPAGQRSEVQLRIASLYIDELERPEEGYAVVAQVLLEDITNPEALELAMKGLESAETRVITATALKSVVEANHEPGALLTKLLAALEGTDDLLEERKDWYARLIELKPGEEALELSALAAAQLPSFTDLWKRAEALAQKLERPEPVSAAYERALARELPLELVNALGKRMMEFHEQWFGDSAALLPALLNLLKQIPQARWALDRAVLALNGQGRFDEVYALFDAAITHAEDNDERISLLDEAALTAKDLAGDAERAIQYLEQLVELRPDDARAHSTLERLYKRCGQTRKLIDLLSRRLTDLEGPALVAMLDQIACRWLELDHSDEALSCVERMLELEAESERACQILETILGTEDFADPDAWEIDAPVDTQETRERAAELLKQTYQRLGRVADVVRIAEIELEFLDDATKRGQLLREVVEAKLGKLDDRLGAFTSLSKLVMLEPTSSEARKQLASLAEELGEPKRHAELLVRAAEDSPNECELFMDAARIYTEKLDDPQREAELYERVLQLASDDRTVLKAARALDRLLKSSGDVDHHCEVLERLAGVETRANHSRDALVRAARIASDALGDWERSAKNWRDVLKLNEKDREALDGLIEVLLGASQWEQAVPVLRSRAELEDAEHPRDDHVRIARIQAEKLGENGKAIEEWQLVRERFGTDKESFSQLCALLEKERRWESFAELLAAEAAQSKGDLRSQLLLRLAIVRRDQLEDYAGALEAFVSAREWREAVSIIEASADPKLAAELTDSLRVIAIERWHGGDELAEDAAYWAVKSRAQQLLDQEDPEASAKRTGRGRKPLSPAEQALALLLESIKLPFEASRRRSLERAAALVSCDALGAPEQALEIFGRIFAEDVADQVAKKSIAKYSALLDQGAHHVQLSELWESLAKALGERGEPDEARSYWERAAGLWEEMSEPERAVNDHRRAADLGSVASLEALTRIHLARDEKLDALEALERIFDLSSGDALVDCALRVFDLSLEVAERARARRRLEQAAAKVPENPVLRQKLADYYRAEELHEELANLLAKEADFATQATQKIAFLREAAELWLKTLGEPARSVPLLAKAAELDPEDRSLTLALAEANSAADNHERAISALTRHIESYGARRPKTRAEFHLQLGRVLRAANEPEKALGEYAQAQEINSTDAQVLFECATAALELGELNRAEQTFRGLLLVLHRPKASDAVEIGRADVYLSLSEVAAKKGDKLATKDFVESAFETALEGPEEARQLEKALKARGKDELLKRALEGRLLRATELEERAYLLADLSDVFERMDEKEQAQQRLKSQAELIVAALGQSEAEGPIHKALARVFARLGEVKNEIKELEAYLSALPLAELRTADADACYRVAEWRINEKQGAHQALTFFKKAVALDPAPERREALLRAALETYPEHVGFARAFVDSAKMTGRANLLAEALAHLARLPESTLDEGRRAIEQCRAVANAELFEKVTTALLERKDLDDETRYYLRSQLAEHYQSSGRIKEAADLKADLAEGLPPKERRALLREVASLYTDELDDDASAAGIYRKLFDDEPQNREIWEPLFSTYLRLGHHSELKALIEETLPKVKNSLDRGALRLAQARLLLESGREVDGAVTALERALEEDPNQREALELLASTLEKLGRLDELVSVFQAQLAQAKAEGDEQAFEALTLRVGALLRQANRPEDAIKTYKALLDETPNHVEALRDLVELSEHADLSEAVHAMRRLLDLEEGPEAAAVAIRLFDLLSRSGDLGGAMRVLEQGFEKYPGDTALRQNLFGAYAADNDHEKAARVLTRALEAAPDDRQLLVDTVDAWCKAGQHARALALVEDRLNERPADELLHFKRARVLEALGREEESVNALQRAHEEGGGYVDELVEAMEKLVRSKEGAESDALSIKLADLLEAQGNAARARAELRNLLEHSPENAEALNRLARLAATDRGSEDAIVAYRGLLKIQDGGDLVQTAFKLIDACERADRLGDVLDDLEAVRRELPDHEKLRERIRAVYEQAGATRRLTELLVDDANRRDKPQTKAVLLAQAARLVIDNDPDRAEQLLEEAERAHSTLESGLLLARLKAVRGLRDEAIAELSRLAQPDEHRKPAARVAAYRELADLHLSADDLVEAHVALAEAHKLERRNGEIALLLGMVSLDLDDEKLAARALRSVTAMKTSSSATPGVKKEDKSTAYYLLGSLARKNGDMNGARRMVQRAVGENPKNQDAQALLEVIS